MTSSDNLAMLFYVSHSFGFIGVPAFSHSPSWVWISRASEICCSRLHLPPHLLVDFYDFLSRMASFDFHHGTLPARRRQSNGTTGRNISSACLHFAYDLDSGFCFIAFELLWFLILLWFCVHRVGNRLGCSGICYDCYDMTDMFMIWDVGCLLMSMLRWWFDLGLLRSHTGWLCNLPLVYFLLSDTWQMPVHVHVAWHRWSWACPVHSFERTIFRLSSVDHLFVLYIVLAAMF